MKISESEREFMSDNSALWRSRQSCLAAKRRYQAETERQSKKGRRRETETFAYMVTDYGGTKGPRALGPLFLEDASFVLSCPPSSFSSTPSRTLQRTPNYLCLHISFLSPSRLFFTSLLSLDYLSSACIMHLEIA